MKAVQTIERARIGVTTGEVYIVRDAKCVAGGWAFKHDDRIPALRHDRFQSSRTFLPLKLIRFVEEVKSSDLEVRS